MPKYKVTSQRWDVPERVIAEFSVDSDKEAKEKFEKEFKNNKNYSWDDLKLIEVKERIVEMSSADQRKNA